MIYLAGFAIFFAVTTIVYALGSMRLAEQLAIAENAKAKAERESISSTLMLDAHKASTERKLEHARDGAVQANASYLSAMDTIYVHERAARSLEATIRYWCNRAHEAEAVIRTFPRRDKATGKYTKR
jgi:hypothetical protein